MGILNKKKEPVIEGVDKELKSDVVNAKSDVKQEQPQQQGQLTKEQQEVLAGIRVDLDGVQPIFGGDLADVKNLLFACLRELKRINK